tara:strand:+ start:328 stop:501 length:174 start_codon:yes stop_codon:yes gene_type:complete
MRLSFCLFISYALNIRTVSGFSRGKVKKIIFFLIKLYALGQFNTVFHDGDREAFFAG